MEILIPVNIPLILILFFALIFILLKYRGRIEISYGDKGLKFLIDSRDIYNSNQSSISRERQSYTGRLRVLLKQLMHPEK